MIWKSLIEKLDQPWYSILGQAPPLGLLSDLLTLYRRFYCFGRRVPSQESSGSSQNKWKADVRMALFRRVWSFFLVRARLTELAIGEPKRREHTKRVKGKMECWVIVSKSPAAFLLVTVVHSRSSWPTLQAWKEDGAGENRGRNQYSPCTVVSSPRSSLPVSDGSNRCNRYPLLVPPVGFQAEKY